MGNCCLRRDPAAVWANDDDDEWLSVCQLHQSEQPEENKLLGEFHFRQSSALSSLCRGSPSSGGEDHQVKIKMTKRELEELVGSRSGGAMDASSVDELLSRAIISDGEDEEVEEHQGPWRPALHSIPEVD